MREVPPRERNAIMAWLLANPDPTHPGYIPRDALGVQRMARNVDLGSFNSPPPAPQVVGGDALGQPRMSAMVDLGSFNNPPPPVQAPPSLDEFNRAEPLPLPPAQMPIPLPRAARPSAGGMTADDLNRMALMQALGQAQPAGQSAVELGAWGNIERRMKMT
jgi:hypothetical protein